jgi:hypothetical protein
MARKRVGDTIDLTIFRNGRRVDIHMTLRRAPMNQ